MSEDRVENVIIIGSGPAGYTAALYTSRANLSPLVIEGFAWGGLLQQTTEVENYPGFTEGIMGPALMQTMRDQAERFGTRFITDMATSVELSTEPGGVHKVWVDEDELHLARTVILAMGAEHKKLGVPGEEELGGRGVSYCATCDAAFFKDANTVIVGGGDSAMEEAIFLSKFARQVDVVHRRDEFRASQIMLDRARSIDNIVFKTPFVVESFESVEGDKLPTARLRNVETGEEDALPNRGHVHRHRPRAPVGDRRRPGRHRRRGLRDHPGALDAHQPARRVRCRRPGRPHLPPGDHRRRLRLSGRAGRRVVPARHAAGPRRRRLPARPLERPPGGRAELGGEHAGGVACRRGPARRARPRAGGRRSRISPAPSRVVEARKASLADRSWSASKAPSSQGNASITTRRVIESRMPVSSAGVLSPPSPPAQKTEEVGASSTMPSPLR